VKNWRRNARRREKHGGEKYHERLINKNINLAEALKVETLVKRREEEEEKTSLQLKTGNEKWPCLVAISSSCSESWPSSALKRRNES